MLLVLAACGGTTGSLVEAEPAAKPLGPAFPEGPMNDALQADLRRISVASGEFLDTDVVARVTIVQIVESVAIVRVDADNWTGHRFTDFFTMLKVDGAWKIMNKVFHLHDA